MLSTRWWRAISIAGTVASGALLLGITKVFDLTVETNLFNTGITPAIIFGIWMLVIAVGIYKNRV